MSIIHRTFVHGAALLLLAAAPSFAQNAVVVTPGGNQTASLQAAIDAAEDGDILVMQGAWTSDGLGPTAIIDGKGLTIVGAADTIPAMRQLFVRNVPEGSLVLLRGLHIEWKTTALAVAGGRVALENCAGSVWLEECVLRGHDGAGFVFGSSGPGFPALTAVSCAAVNVERCSLLGGVGASEDGLLSAWHPAKPGGAALECQGSSLALRESGLRGGTAGVAKTAGPDNPGGSALRVTGGSVLLAGGVLEGGADAGFGASAGPGLSADATATIRRRGTSISAGAGTPAPPAIDAPPGVVSDYPAPPRSIAVDAPLHEQQPGVLHIAAAPGDLLFVFTSFNGGSLALPGKQGVLSLGSPLLGPFVLGVVKSPTGVLDLPFSAPDLLQPQWLGWTTLLQLVGTDGSHALLEGTTSFVLLDASLP